MILLYMLLLIFILADSVWSIRGGAPRIRARTILLLLLLGVMIVLVEVAIPH